MIDSRITDLRKALRGSQRRNERMIKPILEQNIVEDGETDSTWEKLLPLNVPEKVRNIVNETEKNSKKYLENRGELDLCVKKKNTICFRRKNRFPVTDTWTDLATLSEFIEKEKILRLLGGKGGILVWL